MGIISLGVDHLKTQANSKAGKHTENFLHTYEYDTALNWSVNFTIACRQSFCTNQLQHSERVNVMVASETWGEQNWLALMSTYFNNHASRVVATRLVFSNVIPRWQQHQQQQQQRQEQHSKEKRVEIHSIISPTAQTIWHKSECKAKQASSRACVCVCASRDLKHLSFDWVCLKFLYIQHAIHHLNSIISARVCAHKNSFTLIILTSFDRLHAQFNAPRVVCTHTQHCIRARRCDPNGFS